METTMGCDPFAYNNAEKNSAVNQSVSQSKLGLGSVGSQLWNPQRHTLGRLLCGLMSDENENECYGLQRIIIIRIFIDAFNVL